jgi:hypothetical protein
VQGAFPTSVRGTGAEARDSLAAQAASVEREMTRRFDRVTGLQAAFQRADASPVEERDHDLARLAEVLGEGFRVLPGFSAVNAGELEQTFAASDTLQGGDPEQAFQWLHRVAQVRPAAADLNDALAYARALSGMDQLELQVGQLPFQPDDRWIGLPLDAGREPVANRVSLVAEVPTGFDPAAPMAGLLVDEWVETLPSTSETTGVAFHADQPGSRAPNAILIAVPPDPAQPWDLATLERVLRETLDLAKLRAVDTEALSQLGHFLPALFFASNARGKTVSTDFSVNHAAFDRRTE